MLFGCHDQNLYCLDVDIIEPAARLRWKFTSEAPVFSTPAIVGDALTVTCSTNGGISILSTEDGTLRQSFSIDGELFSSPAVSKEHVIFGCRNNNVYCFNVHIN